jgi:cytochrome b561
MVRLAGMLLILGTTVSALARSEGEAAPATTAPPGTGEARQEAPPATDFDFNLLPPSAPKSVEDRALESAISTRRSVLKLHQGFGIATTALLVATVIVGQLNYSDKFGGGGQTGKYELAHVYLESATTLTFVTAGVLALLAPVPLKKSDEGLDTITLHKWAMLATTVGFATQIVLGIIAVSREGYVNQSTFATAHLVVGYSTLAALGTGVTVLLFQ